MLHAPRDPARARLIPLSSLFADPVIRDAFCRAERGQGKAFPVPAKRPAVAAYSGPTRDRKNALVPLLLTQTLRSPDRNCAAVVHDLHLGPGALCALATPAVTNSKAGPGSGWSPRWIKVKNPESSAARRMAEIEW